MEVGDEEAGAVVGMLIRAAVSVDVESVEGGIAEGEAEIFSMESWE